MEAVGDSARTPPAIPAIDLTGDGLAALQTFSERLSRDPDLDAPELLAYDATDLLLLETSGPQLRDLAPGQMVIIGDRHGALTLGASALFGATGVRTHQDGVLGERALHQNADALGLSDAFTSHPLGERLLRHARVVLLQLPRGLGALDEIATAIARFAAADVGVFAGGRDKHMSRSMNEVLARSFGQFSAGRGWRKSRILTARVPLPVGPDAFPRWGSDPDIPFRLAAHGATFGGPTLDHGSRLLLAGLASDAGSGPGASLGSAPRQATADPKRIVDLGCGNGVLAVSAALRWPTAEILATDQSHAAVAATQATAEAAGVTDRVMVHRADGAEVVLEAWADLILLNPPFHSGATVHAGVAHRLIRSCARALAPGGELRLVFNSHLGYRPLVEQVIGTVRQISRDRTFTVLAATRRSSPRALRPGGAPAPVEHGSGLAR